MGPRAGPDVAPCRPADRAPPRASPQLHPAPPAGRPPAVPGTADGRRRRVPAREVMGSFSSSHRPVRTRSRRSSSAGRRSPRTAWRSPSWPSAGPAGTSTRTGRRSGCSRAGREAEGCSPRPAAGTAPRPPPVSGPPHAGRRQHRAVGPWRGLPRGAGPRLHDGGPTAGRVRAHRSARQLTGRRVCPPQAMLVAPIRTSGAPRRAASAVRSSICSCDSRSALTRSR